MAASGISTDHSLAEYILAFLKTSLTTSPVVSCGISLSGFRSSLHYRLGKQSCKRHALRERPLIIINYHAVTGSTEMSAPSLKGFA